MRTLTPKMKRATQGVVIPTPLYPQRPFDEKGSIMAKANSTRKRNPVPDETGNVYGKLTVVSREKGNSRGAVWLCLCECGSFASINGWNLRSGQRKSCGCAASVVETHGHSVGERSPEYVCWAGMKQRCTDANCNSYPNYGAKGVTVCERWLNSFADFLADMGLRPSKRHSLDRYPKQDGNYEPGNVRWATDKEQGNNKSTNRIIEFNGESHTMAEWADILGMTINALFERLKAGWSVERALTTPLKVYRKLKKSNCV